jgi:hypothetical protein
VDILATETASSVANKEKNTLMLISVDWGKMNNEKNLKQKSRDTVPF